MTIDKKDTAAIADMLGLLADYIAADPSGAKAIADHAKALAAKLKGDAE